MSGKRAKRKRREADAELRRVLDEWDPLKAFRAIIARHYGEQIREFPNMDRMCEKCAFRGGDSARLEPLSLIYALEALVTDKGFYCHRDMPIVAGDYLPSSKEQLVPCVGWMIGRWSDDPAYEQEMERLKAYYAGQVELRAIAKSHMEERGKPMRRRLS